MAEPSVRKSAFVHLAIDLDETNLQGLTDARRAQIVENAHSTATQLRHLDVPTVYVSFPRANTKFDLLPASAQWPSANVRQRPHDQLKPAGLVGIDIKTDEDIFMKGSTNAFEGGYLAKHISERYGAAAILLTGGTTTACIPATAEGAVRSGLNVYVATDRLFTTLDWDGVAQAHKLSIEKWRNQKASEESALTGKPSALSGIKTVTINDALDFFALAAGKPRHPQHPPHGKANKHLKHHHR